MICVLIPTLVLRFCGRPPCFLPSALSTTAVACLSCHLLLLLRRKATNRHTTFRGPLPKALSILSFDWVWVAAFCGCVVLCCGCVVSGGSCCPCIQPCAVLQEAKLHVALLLLYSTCTRSSQLAPGPGLGLVVGKYLPQGQLRHLASCCVGDLLRGASTVQCSHTRQDRAQRKALKGLSRVGTALTSH